MGTRLSKSPSDIWPGNAARVRTGNMSGMPWARRSNIEIISEILGMQPASKTAIMYKVNLSHEQLVTYLDFLGQKGLIEAYESNGRIKYKTTEKGGQLLRHIGSVLEELNPDGMTEEP